PKSAEHIKTAPKPDQQSKPAAKAASSAPAKHAAPTKAQPAPQTTPPAPPQPKQPPNLQEKLAGVIHDLHDITGLERIMFAMITPDRKAVRSRIVVGAADDANLKKLEINLEQKHLFSILVSKQQGFWLNRDNHQKYAALIPKEVHNHLNSESFFASSLYVRNKPLGILYADCSNPNELDRNKFSQFKQVSQRLCNELSGK
ncbi:MAG: hypothetical protein MI754_14715, partial [Chromatiales bacterium]|nr:hypothetical protein [Chromatiales bacterium]